ncbi:MAG: hypothetical protein QF632_06480 [Candidatus Woesearchaeota archaeon]|jgi:hypothetical protein|nr:hypothetical protein [Candidatus Woesearchaeota archaeon]MDP7324381.1 hypothetical protein [Candidatus Woesearchaeota archaeon]MDP7457433.1 hypothetical protein [Candidatus Woesearchaeota archaeon]
MALSEALSIIAPYYNLVLVLLVLVIFKKLLSIHYNIHHEQTFTKPWKILMIAVLVFVLETIVTILRAAGIVNAPFFLNGIFEIIIIGLFIYMVFLQREHIRAVYPE